MAGGANFIGKGIALFGLLILAILPLVLPLPQPDALSIDQASFAMDGAAAEPVSLPHAWPRNVAPGTHVGEYRLAFTLGTDEEREQARFLFIPLTRLTPQVQLNGEDLFVVRANAWAAPFFEMPHLARLPADALMLGENILTIRMVRAGGFSVGYLAPAWLGSDAQILPHYQLLSFLVDLQRIAVPALYALLTIGVASVWLARRRDHVYGWLCVMGISLILTNLTALNPFNMLGHSSAAVSIGASALACPIIFGLACAMTGYRRPRWLVPVALACPVIVISTLIAVPNIQLAGIFSLVSVAWLLAAVFVLGRAFWTTRNIEHAMFMIGLMVIIVYALVDTDLISRIRNRDVLLVLYPQVFLITALAFILFRRLAQSLDTLDSANETMRIRLDQQQDELAKAHAHETVLSTNIAREQERQRLMRDLHDGLSGHIVSIIALAESAEEQDIEKAAREALDDLRLVIQSLDIGDEDIPVVLAYFRERTTLQLRRLGIALEWSMDRLPVVTGVTPAHALTLLRILQEAVTNAIKHGPARRIAITGDVTQRGTARITVENDGSNALPVNVGNGLSNMRQRARSLGGELGIAPLPTGMCLALCLPKSLPATEHQA